MVSGAPARIGIGSLPVIPYLRSQSARTLYSLLFLSGQAIFSSSSSSSWSDYRAAISRISLQHSVFVSLFLLFFFFCFCFSFASSSKAAAVCCVLRCSCSSSSSRIFFVQHAAVRVSPALLHSRFPFILLLYCVFLFSLPTKNMHPPPAPQSKVGDPIFDRILCQKFQSFF